MLVTFPRRGNSEKHNFKLNPRFYEDDGFSMPQ